MVPGLILLHQDFEVTLMSYQFCLEIFLYQAHLYVVAHVRYMYFQCYTANKYIALWVSVVLLLYR